jgi:hypothetical protein
MCAVFCDSLGSVIEITSTHLFLQNHFTVAHRGNNRAALSYKILRFASAPIGSA